MLDDDISTDALRQVVDQLRIDLAGRHTNRARDIAPARHDPFQKRNPHVVGLVEDAARQLRVVETLDVQLVIIGADLGDDHLVLLPNLHILPKHRNHELLKLVEFKVPDIPPQNARSILHDVATYPEKTRDKHFIVAHVRSRRLGLKLGQRVKELHPDPALLGRNLLALSIKQRMVLSDVDDSVVRENSIKSFGDQVLHHVLDLGPTPLSPSLIVGDTVLFAIPLHMPSVGKVFDAYDVDEPVFANQHRGVSRHAVLIGHQHDPPVSKVVDSGVALSALEPEYLLEALHLLVLMDLLDRHILDVQHLAAQRKHAVLVAPHNAQPRNREPLGALPLRQN